MTISFDLDDTLIPTTFKFDVEEQNFLQRVFKIENIRKGSLELFKELEKRKIYNERFLLIGENLSYKNFFDMLAQNLNVTAPQKLAKKWQAIAMSYFESLRTFLTGSYPIITSETVKSSYQNTSYSNAKIVKEIGFSFTPISQSIAQTAKIFLAFEVKNKR
mgnify:CR=1 FL=1